MLPTSASFIAEKNKRENAPIYLYTIVEYNGVDNLTLAEYDTDITYDGVTYYKFPIAHENIGDNKSGSIDTVKVTLCNVNRAIQSYLEAYDLRGKKVIIRLVWADKLDDADAHLDFTYYIDSYGSDQNSAEFTLMPKIDVLSITLPKRVYSRMICGWVFKSTECGYAGADTVCAKTKADCKLKANYVRFGAFPSVPSLRVYTK